MSDYWQKAEKIHQDHVLEEESKLLSRFCAWFGDDVPDIGMGKNYNDNPIIEFTYFDKHLTYNMIAEWGNQKIYLPSYSPVVIEYKCVRGWEIKKNGETGTSTWGVVTDKDNAVSELFAICDNAVQRERADKERRKAIIVSAPIDKQDDRNWLERLARKDAV